LKYRGELSPAAEIIILDRDENQIGFDFRNDTVRREWIWCRIEYQMIELLLLYLRNALIQSELSGMSRCRMAVARWRSSACSTLEVCAGVSVDAARRSFCTAA